MIWLSIWLPDRMPRSVETSKMTVWVGIFSLMVFRTTESFASCVRFRNRSETGSPRTRPVLDRQAEQLRERRLARTEEAGHPDGDAFVRLLRRLLVPLEHLHEMPLDGVGDDVLVDFGGDDVLGGLVDLDDLLDLPGDVVGEQRGDLRHGTSPQKIFGR